MLIECQWVWSWFRWHESDSCCLPHSNFNVVVHSFSATEQLGGYQKRKTFCDLPYFEILSNNILFHIALEATDTGKSTE